MSWFFHPSADERPRWARAIGKSGAQHGLYFFCDVCRFEIRHDAPMVVRHCNRDEHAPADTSKLPTFSLVGGGSALPSNLIPTGGWDDPEIPEPEPRMEWL